jgi:hypothetical protein
MTLPETELRRGPSEAAIPAMETNLQDRGCDDDETK